MKDKTKKGNAGIVLLICLLFVVVIVMGVYMVLDKTGVINSDNEVNNGGSTNVVDNIQVDNGMKIESAEFFDEYLKVFLPQWSAGNFQRTITEFTDEDISSFLFWYVKNSDEYEVSYDYNVSSEISCQVKKSDFDAVVKKYFDKDTYKIILASQEARDGIRKLSDGIYEVFWFATSSMRPTAYNESVKYDGSNVEVVYNLKYEYAAGTLSDEKLTFNLVYSDGRYIVKKITYDKAYYVGDEIRLKDGSVWKVIKESKVTDDYVTVLGEVDYAEYLQGDNYDAVLDQMYTNFVEYKGSALDKYMQSQQSRIPANLKEVDGYKIRLITLDEIYAIDNNWCKTEGAKYTYCKEYWNAPVPADITTMTLVKDKDREKGKQWAYYTLDILNAYNSEYNIITTWKNGLGGFYPVANIYKNSIVTY